MSRVFFIGQVGVYRKCADCGMWKGVDGFRNRCCSACRRRNYMPAVGHTNPKRNIALTDKGHALLRELGVPRSKVSA